VVEAAPLVEWVAQMLEELGHEVIVIDPRRAKAVIQTKNKTDKLDARIWRNWRRRGGTPLCTGNPPRRACNGPTCKPGKGW
jgi:transposase